MKILDPLILLRRGPTLHPWIFGFCQSQQPLPYTRPCSCATGEDGNALSKIMNPEEKMAVKCCNNGGGGHKTHPTSTFVGSSCSSDCTVVSRECRPALARHQPTPRSKRKRLSRHHNIQTLQPDSGATIWTAQKTRTTPSRPLMKVYFSPFIPPHRLTAAFPYPVSHCS